VEIEQKILEKRKIRGGRELSDADSF